MSFQTSNKFAAFILAKLSCLGSPSKEKKKTISTSFKQHIIEIHDFTVMSLLQIFRT